MNKSIFDQNKDFKAFVIGLYRQGNTWERISVICNVNVIEVKIMIAKYLGINVHYL